MQLFRVLVLAKFGERLGFDLADTFAGNREFLPDLFERVAFAVVEAETHTDDLLLAVEAITLSSFLPWLLPSNVRNRYFGTGPKFKSWVLELAGG